MSDLTADMGLFAAFVVLLGCTQLTHGYNYTAGEPPKFSKGTEHKTQYFTLSDPLVIQCPATGDPEVQFRWTKDGETFNHVSGRYAFSTTALIPSLVIQTAERQDAGWYQCFATNKFGTAVSASIEVVQAYIRPDLPFHVGNDPREKSVTAGDALMLPCYHPDSAPQAITKWILRSPGGKQDVSFSNRITMDQQGNLRFSYVVKEDEEGGNVYACTGSNVAMQIMVENPGFTIKVKDQPLSTQPATIWVSPAKVKVLRGETLTLDCIFRGYPVPSITWDKVGGTLPDNRVQHVTNQPQHLTIVDVQQTDAGTYTCSADTGDTGVGDAAAANIDVVVEAAPYRPGDSTQVAMAMESHVRAPTESVTFDCRAEGIPRPTYKWYINGTPIRDIVDRTEVTEGQLTIPNLHMGDNMVVQCNASNVHGYLWNNAHLIMQNITRPTTPQPSTGTQVYAALSIMLLPILHILISTV